MTIISQVLQQYSKNQTYTEILAGKEARTLWGDLDAFYCRVEKEILNPLGYIPVVGTAVGVTRLAMASFQASFFSFGLMFENVCGIFSSNRIDSIRHYDGAGACQEHIIHATLNVVRGAIELVPLLPLITLLPYDAMGSFYRYRSQMSNCSIVPIQQKIDVLQKRD